MGQKRYEKVKWIKGLVTICFALQELEYAVASCFFFFLSFPLSSVLSFVWFETVKYIVLLFFLLLHIISLTLTIG